MPRSMWSGTLSFGLVSVPVKLYSAVSHKSVHFHQLHAGDHARIQQRRYCSAEDVEVPFSDIIKGFEIAPERYVVIEEEEFAALEPAFTRTIDIEDFVELDEIDPIYFDQPYFLAPAKGGERSYRLLLETMRETSKVAIARIVLRSRERLVAIRPREDALLMTTMNFGDEIQSAENLRELDGAEVPLGERELSVAKRLVESIAEPFDIGKYHDTYREALLDLIDRKANGEETVVQPPPKPERTSAPDLMSALQASLDEVRGRQGKDGKGATGPAKKSPSKSTRAAKKSAVEKSTRKKPQRA